MNLKKLRAEAVEKLKELRNKLATCKDEELDALEADINSTEEQIRSLNKKIEMEAKAQRSILTNSDDLEEPEEESSQSTRSVITAQPTESPKARKSVDVYDSVEYREAFMEYCQHGTQIPVKFRANAITKTSDASAVIPTTILNEIIREMSEYGSLYAKVRKLNIQGGVQIPILTLKPVATWITADTGTSESDLQKIQANTKITFSYYGLECKVSQTLLTEVTTLEMFQQLFTSLAVEAMAHAIDVAIMNGNGSGQPLGITKDSRVPAKNTITLAAADIKSWTAWKKKVFGAMKKSYRNGEFFMAQGTFDGYIDGMVDDVQQPIGRVNYGIDGAEVYRFGGKTVETVEDDILPNYDNADVGSVFAVFADLSNYGWNSNMQMTSARWVDNDTNEIKNKVILIADGKLIDPYGVLLIKKG